MVSVLIVGLALSVGQTDAGGEAPPEPVPTAASAPVAPERWLLMKSLQGTYPGWLLDGNRMRVSGWTEASYTASSASDSNLPVGLNYRANEFLLQQNWLRVERTVVTAGTTEPTFGFRTDTILPGSDYRFTLPRGLFNRQLTANDGGPNTYGIDPVQFYTEAYFPTVGRGLDLKLGRTYCQFGVESTEAVGNPLVSHSYTFFYDPFTQTGLLALEQLTPAWSVQAGVNLGPDVFIDPAASPYGVFSLKWAPPSGPDSVLFSLLAGSGRYNVAEQFNNPNVFDVVYTHAINAVATYTLDALFGYQTNVPDVGTATWFGLVNYLTCKLTPRTSATGRLEFFDDTDGNRTGFRGLYTAATAGLVFKPLPGLIVRQELRFDYNPESRPFEDKHGLLTAAADMIVRW